MSDVPTIDGERTELKPGFFLITRDADGGGKLLAFWNSTKDLQFNVAYEFQAPDLVPLGETVSDGPKCALTVYPAETKEFVKGQWKASRRTLSFGAPDKVWQERQAAQLNQEIEAEIRAVKAALKRHPKSDGRYTSDYIADVCVREGVAFVDLIFPPRATSIAREFEGVLPYSSAAWMRPSAYCPPDRKACLYAGRIEPNDIDQGALPNCYLLCALACIAEFEHLVRAAFPALQHPEHGAYTMQLCKNGWWQLVTVDDLLPINAATRLPLFAKNREEVEELWVSLLEKAYAKLHGSYAAIRAGDPALAMGDIVGGPFEKLQQRPEWDDKAALFDFLRCCDTADHLMSLGTPGVDTSSYGGSSSKGASGTSGDAASLAAKYKAVGLVTGHAFSLISVVRTKQGGHRLCKIRNPWGGEDEWNGDWSDDSPLWTPELQREVGFEKADDGTFWMGWDDVVKWFDSGSVTYVLKDHAEVRVAGNFDGGFPDVVVQLVATKEVHCWFGGHQRDNRGLPPGDKDLQYLGLLAAVLRDKGNGAGVEKIATSGNGQFLTARDVFVECTLAPSPQPYYVLLQAFQDADKSFVLSCFLSDTSAVKVHFLTAKGDEGKKRCNPVTRFVPATCSQKAAANFQVLLPQAGRVLVQSSGDGVVWSAAAESAAKRTRAARESEKNAKPVGSGSVSAASIASAPQRLRISVTIISGHGLVSKDLNGLSDPFVMLARLDEGGKVHPKAEEFSTKYIKNTLDPVWGETFVFSQLLATDALRFECWDKDLFGKDFMGRCVVPVASLGLVPGGDAKVQELPLSGDDATGHLKVLFSALV